LNANTIRPVIAVVVPTFNRAHLLEALVASLENQDVDLPYEVVIVDDSSKDHTQRELARLSTRTRVPLRALRLDEKSGPARARNLAWRSSSAEWIAFTDDDCTPQRGWLRGLARGLERHDIVQGRTEPHPDQHHLMGPFTRSISVGAENGFYGTANIAYRRSVLEHVDGFNEDFPYAAGEDTDLGCRARSAGATYIFEPTALVYHDIVGGSAFDYVRNARRWAGVVRVVRTHPELKRAFARGPFWLRSHRWAMLAAAGVAWALAYPRHRLVSVTGGLAMSLPYFAYRLRADPLPGATPIRLRHLPVAFLGNLAEALTHIAAQIRFALRGG
jgi:glycosyltransferase involved in cell wall biosynthesis